MIRRAASSAVLHVQGGPCFDYYHVARKQGPGLIARVLPDSQVIKMCDEMVATLKKEQVDDDSKKESAAEKRPRPWYVFHLQA